MSTLRVDNLQASDGLTPAYGTVGVAKAGVYYNQDTPAVTGSFNVSSVSDDAVGEFTVTITNDFGAADYVVAGMSNRTTAEASPRWLGIDTNAGGKAVGTCKFVSHFSATDYDQDDNNAAFFGDLA